MNEWMNEWMDGWMDGWMEGWVDEWMDGWMDDILEHCTSNKKWKNYKNNIWPNLGCIMNVLWCIIYNPQINKEKIQYGNSPVTTVYNWKLGDDFLMELSILATSRILLACTQHACLHSQLLASREKLIYHLLISMC